MPPKNKSTKGKNYAGRSFNMGRASGSAFEIDVEKIPSCQQVTLDLNLFGVFLYYPFVSLICAIRQFSTFKMIFVGSKSVVSAGDTMSNNNFFLVTLIYADSETRVLIGLHDIYLYGVHCHGNWLYPTGGPYTIKGGSPALFDLNYPINMEKKVGLEVVRNCVIDLHNDDVTSWAKAYYRLALNLAESVRFHSIFLRVLMDGSTVLDKVNAWLINKWDVMSKLWKLACRYNKWIPGGVVCEIGDVVAAESIIAIVLDTELTRNEITTLDKRYAVVAPDVK